MRAIRDSAALQTIALIILLPAYTTATPQLSRIVLTVLWAGLNVVIAIFHEGATRIAFILLQVTTLALIWLGVQEISPLLVLGSPVVWWFAYASVHDSDEVQARQAPFQSLLQRLGTGWTQYTPRNPDAQSCVQVYTSPGGQVFYLARTVGVPRTEYGEDSMGWQTPDINDLRRYAAADVGVRQHTQLILWVEHAMQMGTYEASVRQGVTVLLGDAPTVAAALRDFAAMRARLEGGQPTPSDLGRQVEEDAIAELEGRLLPGWRMRTRVLLAQGGDADIELTTPGGVRYAVDVKARTDRMDLSKPKGDRAKSWREIHAQVTGAARQLGGDPVVWQPRTKDTDMQVIAGVWCLRGDAATLLTALEELGRGDPAEAESPHMVLGVAPGATLEQIKEAYRDLARRYHPDRVSNFGEEFRLMAERRMKAINAAYQQLIEG